MKLFIVLCIILSVFAFSVDAGKKSRWNLFELRTRLSASDETIKVSFKLAYVVKELSCILA